MALRGRIVVTGGTGFIGSHLVERLLSLAPKRLSVLSRSGGPHFLAPLKDRVEIIRYSSSRDYAARIVKLAPDHVFILGGGSDPRLSLVSPEADLQSSLLNQLALLQALKNARLRPRLIYASSVAVYGFTSGRLNERSPTCPASPYGISRLAAEHYFRVYSRQFGIPAFSVRLFPTYGPRLRRQVVFDFISRLLLDPRKLTIRGDGTEVRDLSYVDDQIDGLVLLARKAEYAGEVYNLGSGSGISVAKLAARIAETMGLRPRLFFQPARAETHHGRVWISDSSLARSLGQRSKIGLAEGLKATVDWVRAWNSR